MNEGGATALLARLRALSGATGLAFVSGPTLIPSGHETEVYDLELSSAPSRWDGGLVLRLFAADAPSHAARFEAGVHEGLRAQGFPAPRIVAVGEDAPCFLLMERLPGRGLGDGLEVEEGVSSRLRTLAGAVRLAVGLPGRLGPVTRDLLALDPEPVLGALEARGVARERVGFDRQLEDLDRRIAARDELKGLVPGLDWLHRRRPDEPARLAVCHGDLTPNLIFDGARLSGVVDWSAAFVTVGDPAFELGNSAAMIQVPMPLPAPLRAIASAYQAWLVRAFLRAVGPVAEGLTERILYYETCRLLRALVGAAELWIECAGGAPFPERPDPWKVPAIALQVAERVRAHTGASLVLPEPPARV